MRAYARSVPILINKGIYSSFLAAHESVRHVSTYVLPSTSTSEEPSWTAHPPGDLSARRILDRVRDALRRSKGRVANGLFKFVCSVPLSSHPWYAHETRLRRRREQRRGAVAYRSALAKMTAGDERRMLRAGNSSVLFSVRQATTYNVRSPDEKEQGLRPTKKRPWRGIGAPDVIPARQRLIGMKRRVFEQSSRVGHAMITQDKNGEAVVWAYVRGSGLTGVRLYKSPGGAIKRLAAHAHKQRRAASAPGLPSEAASTTNCAMGQREEPDRRRAGDGVATPSDRERRTSRGSGAGDTPTGAAGSGDGGASTVSGDPFAHASALSDRDVGASPSDQQARLTLEELRILRSSTLEDLDGTNPDTILAVEFDIVAAVRAAIAGSTRRCTVDDITGGKAAWSMGSDGGPMRRSAITLFSLVLSASWLYKGRTAMLPIIYVLAGEQHIHSCLGDRLDALLAEAVNASYAVPVHSASVMTSNDGGDDIAAAADLAAGVEASQSFFDWTGPCLLRVVGDFSMLSHIMGMTGGSDDSRCPYWWPCTAGGFLSLTAHAAEHGRARTVPDLSRQWEIVCWVLARWAFLRNESAGLQDGLVTARCSNCRSLTPLLSPHAADFQCNQSACTGRATRAFSAILPTPLTAMFNLLRRRAGGVRSYPVIRSVPTMLQVPVLHCTGSIMKKLIFFFLADLGDAPKAAAKQGMYSVTGRVSLGQLYLREHIKLAALIVACEDIVGGQVDSAVLSMWSLTLLLSAAWRQALTGRIEERDTCVQVMELAAGLLAPMWSALKPLDKESKGAGVASLYLHAALMHARDSMGQNASAEAVITDDHVEGALRDMSKHCGSRVNNVARAQAVTEFQALAEDSTATTSRNRFSAELVIYTKFITVCACCATDLGGDKVSDFDKAIGRAEMSGVVTVPPEYEHDTTRTCLQLPSSLVYNPESDAGRVKPMVSKERKVARTLARRLAVINMCVCGKGWGRERGSLGRRLVQLQQADGQSMNGTPDPVAPAGPRARRRREPVPATQVDPPGRAPIDAAAPDDAAESFARKDARSWMQRHSTACLEAQGECDGTCVGMGDDPEDELPIDALESFDEDTIALSRGGPEGVEALDHDVLAAQEPLGAVPEPADAGPVDAPFLAAGVLNDTTLRAYAPPQLLLKALLDEDDGCLREAADTDACRARIDEEDMLLRVFLVRMREKTFEDWAKSHSVHWHAMHDAVLRVLRRLNRSRASLPGATTFTL